MPTAGRLATATGLLVLGGAIALLGSRALGGGGEDALLREVSERQGAQFEQVSELVEEQLRARQEAALTQFFRLQSFRRVAGAGLEITWIVAGAGDGDPWRALEAGGEARRVPRLAWDSAARAGWDDLAHGLGDLEGGVDPRVVETFSEILDYAAAHPWPDRPDLAAVRASGWSDPPVVEEWLSLNRALQARVDGLLAEF